MKGCEVYETCLTHMGGVMIGVEAVNRSVEG